MKRVGAKRFQVLNVTGRDLIFVGIMPMSSTTGLSAGVRAVVRERLR